MVNCCSNNCTAL